MIVERDRSLVANSHEDRLFNVLILNRAFLLPPNAQKVNYLWRDFCSRVGRRELCVLQWATSVFTVYILYEFGFR